ncbi:hypothetical protein U6A24_13145 [Aquimarina gracilis]|uniref:DUF4412 domain-containing protein n=1 Tax=Aquimarina gracilis TaxID=874422 RepID=A0ABU5ZX32_9FLAO|nr:hypothetical protein [Aquimarina gracilis]MEB3346416.1 hypothetical protein [Aquimarina gracilis]
MKHIVILVFSLFLASRAIGQFLPEGYKLDGAVSAFELTDSLAFKKIYKDDHLLIKENKEAYYVGIQSDLWTIANLYYLGDKQFKIMHVSGAMGETNYNLTDKGWIKDRDKWDWQFRDPMFWKEMHPEAIQDQELFYKTFDWVGSVVSYGSFRELEFIISKKLATDFKKLRVTFQLKDGDGRKLITGPGNEKEITPDPKLNLDLHMGELPKTIKL